MTMKEYAHSCAEELKKLPTQKTVVKVCNKILHLQVDGRDITSSEVEIILGYTDVRSERWNVRRNDPDSKTGRENRRSGTGERRLYL